MQYNGKKYEKVIAWGVGRALPKYEYAMEYIDYIVDKNSDLSGKKVFGLKIYLPEKLWRKKEIFLSQ